MVAMSDGMIAQRVCAASEDEQRHAELAGEAEKGLAPPLRVLRVKGFPVS
jgi:hypothetical protein